MNVRKKKLGAFKDELIALYLKHGVSIGHEDGHGAFIIRDYREDDVRWIKNATNEATESSQHATKQPNDNCAIFRAHAEEVMADPEAYFEKHARYDPRNGPKPYSIVFRGYGFTSGDTHDLAVRFHRAVARYRKMLSQGLPDGEPPQADQ